YLNPSPFSDGTSQKQVPFGKLRASSRLGLTRLSSGLSPTPAAVSPLQDSLKIANPPLSRGASPGFDPATAATAEGCCLPKLNSCCSIAAALKRTDNSTVLSRRCLSPHCSGPSRHWAGWPMRADRRHSSAG